MKGIFIILDGVADQQHATLKHQTPLAVAKTPNLDALARKSKIFHCYTLKEGLIPESSSAIVSLLGYDPTFAPRGPLEAIGAGMQIKKGDLAFRTNFATVEDLETNNILDRRAGRTLTTKEAKILAKTINQEINLPFKHEFRATNQHRGVLVFRGGFSDNISNVDPAYGDGVAKTTNNSKIKFSKPLDDEDDSKLSAELLNAFTRKTHELLDKHPLNRERAKKGLFSANFILSRDAGNTAPGFKKLRGKWMALAYMPLEKGIAKSAKMDLWTFDYPKLKGIDAYQNLYDGMRKAIKNANKMLGKNKDKYDYYYIHIKETDLPGHDNKPLEKVRMIEILDQKLFGTIRHIAEKQKVKVVITADHTTACRMKSHTADPVPVLYYNPKKPNEKQGRRYTEEEGLKGKKVMGRKLLEKTLFEK